MKPIPRRELTAEQVLDWARRLQRLPDEVSKPLPLNPDFLDPFWTIIAEMRATADRTEQ